MSTPVFVFVISSRGYSTEEYNLLIGGGFLKHIILTLLARENVLTCEGHYIYGQQVGSLQVFWSLN